MYNNTIQDVIQNVRTTQIHDVQLTVMCNVSLEKFHRNLLKHAMLITIAIDWEPNIDDEPPESSRKYKRIQ